MSHPLIGAVFVCAVSGACVLAASRGGGAPRASDAGLLISDLAISQVSAAEAAPKEVQMAALRGVVASDAPAGYALGGSTRTSMLLSDAQRAEIRRQLSLLAAPVVRPALRNIAIGDRLPRESVRISRLPSQIAQVAPQYGGFEHVVTDMGALVIVDPKDYRVVDII